jgi:hypothetical protein
VPLLIELFTISMLGAGKSLSSVRSGGLGLENAFTSRILRAR